MDDAAIGINEVTSTEDSGEEELARRVAEYLVEAYPRHLWYVGWQGGAIVIKHGATDTRFGFVLPKHFSASDLKRNAILGAGELLERAGIPRSAWNAINQTGDDLFESLLSGQLQRNKLTSEGIKAVVTE